MSNWQMGASRRAFLASGLCSAAALLIPEGAARAQTRAQTPAQSGRPLPRFVSLRGSEGNVRRGPSWSHRIDWVFKHQFMPLLITAEYESWRRVEDVDGQGGWMYVRLLSNRRTVLMLNRDETPWYFRPNLQARVVAAGAYRAIASLEQVEDGWCRVSAQGVRGWVPQDQLWGVMPGERYPA